MLPCFSPHPLTRGGWDDYLSLTFCNTGRCGYLIESLFDKKVGLYFELNVFLETQEVP